VKRCGERNISERRPRVKVRVQIEMPRMVRNWRCQPKESFCGVLVLWWEWGWEVWLCMLRGVFEKIEAFLNEVLRTNWFGLSTRLS
jgi:hypothetical protein